MVWLRAHCSVAEDECKLFMGTVYSSTSSEQLFSEYERMLCSEARLTQSELVMGHFFKTQPNPKFLDPTQPTKVFTRPTPTHHGQSVWHIRLYRLTRKSE